MNQRPGSLTIGMTIALACLTACGGNDKERCDEYICVSPASYECSSPVATMKVTVTTQEEHAAYIVRVTQDKDRPKREARLLIEVGAKFTEEIRARQSVELLITGENGSFTRTFDRERDCKTSA